MALKIIITNAGRAALVNAANTGTAAVTIAQVGITATAVTPSNTANSLPNEIKRIAALSGDVVADDIIHLIVRDESTSVFTVRSFALYLADGTLFAIYGQTNPILEKSAQAMMLLAIDVQFADIDAAQLTFGNANFLNPPATTEIQGVVELATEDETATGVDTQRAVTPKTLKSAVTKWIDTRFGEGAPSAFVKTLLTAASAIAMRASLGIKSAALKDEGSGNNLDADFLDGQHGAYYADVPARLGFTPLNKAGDTVTGSLGVIGDLTLSNTGTIGYLNRPNVVGSKRLAFNTKGGGNLEAVDIYSDVIRFNNGTAWHSGNDGAGSGMDADLLDGQDGSFYSNVIARLGFTPLNKAGDTYTGRLGRDAAFYTDLRDGNPVINFAEGDYFTFDRSANSLMLRVGEQLRLVSPLTGNLDLYSSTGAVFINNQVIWTAANDGAGSGLDAGLLAGQLPSYYTNVIARLGYTPLNKAGDRVDGALAVTGTLSVDGELTISNTGTTGYINRPNVAGSKRLTFNTKGGGNLEAFDVYSDLIRFNGGTAWHSGNDGSGSGLDADLLDGKHGSDYFPSAGGAIGGFTYLAYSSEYAGFAVRNNYGSASRSANTFFDSINENGITVGNMQFGQNADGSTTVLFGLSPPGSRTVDRRQTAMILRGPGQALDFYTGSMWNNGVRIWDGASDGSGSGLDADLLDGLQGSDYAKIADFTRNLAATGFERLPNGRILQWGRISGRGTFSFFTAFPNACFQVLATNADAQGDYNDNAWAYPLTTSTFYAGTKSSVTSNSYGNYGISYIAIGY